MCSLLVLSSVMHCRGCKKLTFIFRTFLTFVAEPVHIKNQITPLVLPCRFHMSGKEPTKEQGGEQGGVLDSVKEAGKGISNEISKSTGGSQVLGTGQKRPLANRD